MSIYMFRKGYRKKVKHKTQIWINDVGVPGPGEENILDKEVFLVMSTCTMQTATISANTQG